MREVKSDEGRGTSKCQGTGKIVRYNRGTLRVACVTSVSVWFRNISRVAKTENPVPRLSLLRNQRHSMTFGRFIRLIIRDPFLERSKNFSGQRQILESKPVE